MLPYFLCLRHPIDQYGGSLVDGVKFLAGHVRRGAELYRMWESRKLLTIIRLLVYGKRVFFSDFCAFMKLARAMEVVQRLWMDS